MKVVSIKVGWKLRDTGPQAPPVQREALLPSPKCPEMEARHEMHSPRHRGHYEVCPPVESS